MKIEIGDVVTLNPSSSYAKLGSKNNPIDKPGMVVRDNNTFRDWVDVYWETGHLNNYPKKDLILHEWNQENRNVLEMLYPSIFNEANYE